MFRLFPATAVFTTLLLFTQTLEVVAEADNFIILSWINHVLRTLGADFWDPNPTTDPILEINNLQPVSLANAEYYINFAFAAYCSQRLLSNWTCPQCLILGSNVRYISTVENTTYGTLGFFAVDDTRKEIILAYRGSFNLPNIIADATLVQYSIDDTDIRVHTGSYIAQQSLISQVRGKLDLLIAAKPGYRVIVTGHSLGGSMASLTMFQFKYYGLYTRINFELYTYGALRQGNQAYATKFNSFNFPVGRVVNRADIIPHIVPFSLGYVHHANEVYIVNGVTRNCSNVYYEDLSCSDSLGPIYSVFDHLFYFDADVTTCVLESPIDLVLQFFFNLRPYLPQTQFIDFD